MGSETTGNQTGRPIEILLVEDNPGDVRLAKEAFKDARIANTIHVVGDGVEAMDFLRENGRYAAAKRPDLILLDLNLPRKDGREVLAEIKSDRDLAAIPVVIMTSSSDETDIVRTYEQHANCYITKPIDLKQFLEVMLVFQDFWMTVVTLPTNEPVQP